MHNCICSNNQYVNLPVPSFATCKYYHNVIELLDLLQCFLLTCNMYWFGFLEGHTTFNTLSF